MAALVGMTLAKRIYKSAKIGTKPKITTVRVKFGKPVREVTFRAIKNLTGISVVLLIISIIFSLDLFCSAVSIKNRLGTFINMISKGHGEKLPLLQALPVLAFIIIDFAFCYFLFKLFDTKKRAKLNWILFVLLMVSLALIFIIFVILIVILTHIYEKHEELHSGIIEAMKKYSSNSVYKKRIDRLQIELQCCGSKKYDEWYNVSWYDTKLVKKGAIDNSQGNTPFSCCSMSSMYPCIHHNIENTGKAYLYTPEQNLSISTNGCYTKLRQKKQEIGWKIIGNLFLYSLLQGGIVICLRFLQTGHFVNSKFSGHSQLYTIWLFGCYAGKSSETAELTPPQPPPLPPELMK